MKYYISYINLNTGEVIHSPKAELEKVRSVVKGLQQLDKITGFKYKYLISSATIPQEESERYLKQFYLTDQITILHTEEASSPSPKEKDILSDLGYILKCAIGVFFGLLLFIGIIILI